MRKRLVQGSSTQPAAGSGPRAMLLRAMLLRAMLLRAMLLRAMLLRAMLLRAMLLRARMLPLARMLVGLRPSVR